MIDPQRLHRRRIHAILFLEGKRPEQRSVTGVGSWDGTHLALLPDGGQSPLPVPLFDGKAPAYELTPEVKETFLQSDADNAETLRQAIDVADFIGMWPVPSLPSWSAAIPAPLAIAWIPGWPVR